MKQLMTWYEIHIGKLMVSSFQLDALPLIALDN